MTKFPEVETHIWIETHEFQPIDTKKFVGLSTEERDGTAKDYWVKMDPLFHDGGNSESFRAFVERVNASLLKLKKLDGLNYVFTHGNYIRCLWVLLNDFSDFRHNKKQIISICKLCKNLKNHILAEICQ